MYEGGAFFLSPFSFFLRQSVRNKQPAPVVRVSHDWSRSEGKSPQMLYSFNVSSCGGEPPRRPPPPPVLFVGRLPDPAGRKGNKVSGRLGARGRLAPTSATSTTVSQLRSRQSWLPAC